MMEQELETAKMFEGNDNPQVKQMYIEAIAKAEALDDVLRLARKEVK